MKVFIIILVSTVSLSCTNNHQQIASSQIVSKAIYVVVDATDKKRLWPSATSILQQFKLNENPTMECWFGLLPISDKEINQSYVDHLSDNITTERLNTEDDPQYRAKQVLQFYEAVKNSYTHFYKDFDTSKAMRYSQCLAAISTALTELQKTGAEDKELFIYSDLSENSSIFNTYRVGVLRNPEDIEKKCIKAGLLPQQLHGIHITIGYIPETRFDDKRFAVMLEVYKHILEARGATVTLNTEMNNSGS